MHPALLAILLLSRGDNCRDESDIPDNYNKSAEGYVMNRQ